MPTRRLERGSAASNHRPPALRRGDTIGIIAPSGTVDADRLGKGIRELERLGFRVLLAENVLERDGYFAGDERSRTDTFLSLLRNPEVAAVISARGGYGSNYITERLSTPAVLRSLQRLRPKIVMGYSDVTTLLLFLRQRLGWVTFQGPMLTKDFANGEGAYDRAVFENVLSRPSARLSIQTDAVALRPGTADGRLTGGCLSLLVATLGTPEEIETRGSILLIEDIAEKPYRIDRMLFHLRRAGKFRGVNGFVFGEMIGCAQTLAEQEDLRNLIQKSLGSLNVPVVFGVRFGHTTGGCLTIPLGVRARLTVKDKVTLTLLEPAVSRKLNGPRHNRG